MSSTSRWAAARSILEKERPVFLYLGTLRAFSLVYGAVLVVMSTLALTGAWEAAVSQWILLNVATALFSAVFMAAAIGVFRYMYAADAKDDLVAQYVLDGCKWLATLLVMAVVNLILLASTRDVTAIVFNGGNLMTAVTDTGEPAVWDESIYSPRILAVVLSQLLLGFVTSGRSLGFFFSSRALRLFSLTGSAYSAPGTRT